MILTILVALGLALVAGFALFRGVLGYLQFKLRAPPSAWLDVVALAQQSGAPLPVAVRTPALRRQLILRAKRPALFTNLRDMTAESVDIKADPTKRRIVGFLHPNAHAGGGGERVLWAAVKATLADPTDIVAVYVAAEQGLTPKALIERAVERFGLSFTQAETDRIVVVFLTQKQVIEPDFYPILTLFGQAIGSAILGYEAISNLMPDVMVDTTGLAFSYPAIRLFGQIPVVAYVHYPFIQSDMLNSLKLWSPKQLYWRSLMLAYRWAGSYASLAMVNSSWTLAHIQKGWAKPELPFSVVYPPVAVHDFPEPGSEQRTPAFVYIAQFRPEKRHELVLKAFANVVSQGRKAVGGKRANLIFVGSVRNAGDQLRVANLRSLATELGLTENDFIIVENAPWASVQRIINSSFAGVNAMWNEHFGMGVVETMAAGLIPVVHASAGPLLDIVKDDQGAPGFFFTSKSDPDYSAPAKYPKLSEAMIQALKLSPQESTAMSKRAWKASQRFSDEAFATAWTEQFSKIASVERDFTASRRKNELFD